MSDDLDTLARTLYGEARGEGEYGMQAVANVIMNRAAAARDFVDDNGRPHPLFGDGTPGSACLVCHHDIHQFSCWNDNDPNCRLIEDVTDSDPLFAQAQKTAGNAINGLLDDTTNGATYYYARGTPTPYWAEGKDPCAVIGHHLFFKDIN